MTKPAKPTDIKQQQLRNKSMSDLFSQSGPLHGRAPRPHLDRANPRHNACYIVGTSFASLGALRTPTHVRREKEQSEPKTADLRPTCCRRQPGHSKGNRIKTSSKALALQQELAKQDRLLQQQAETRQSTNLLLVILLPPALLLPHHLNRTVRDTVCNMLTG